MDLNNIEEKIQELHGQLFQLEKTNKRLDIIKHELELLYRDLTLHKAKIEKEYEDVIKLKKMSASLLFRTILGNFKQQLEKERQQYLQAVLEYNSIANEIDLLQYEKEVLEKKTNNTLETKQQLDYYLKVKEQKILFHNSDKAKKIKEINRSIDQVYTLKRELKEAKQVAVVVDKLLIKAFGKLKKVDSFKFTKMRGAGKNSSFAKKSYIDQAIKDASEINYFLNKLDKELSDVYSKYTFFNIYKYQNFVDSFYDNLITDWVLQNKLRNAISCLKSADNQVKRILATLDNDLQKAEDSIEEKKAAKRELITEI